MRKVQLFALMMGASLTALAALLIWYLYGFESGKGTISGMMGQMMGGQYGGATLVAMPWYVWGGLLILFGLIAAAAVGLGLYLAVPEIRTVADQDEGKPIASAGLGNPKQDWNVLVRSSKPDERKVLEVLAAHNGTYLQKFIVKESGLSKLKTHRIISRFAERGVVSAVKSGNTNEISLASWLARPESPAEP